MGENPPHFLIVGSHRSGTTLVQRLATELPGVQVTPETAFFPMLLRQRKVKISDFPLDRAGIQRVLRSYRDYPRTQDLRFDINEIADRLLGHCPDPWTLFSELVRQLAPDATIVGEKTPNHLRWWRPLHAACPSLKFVWIVRDPRAVVASAADAPWGMDSIWQLAVSWRADAHELKSARLRLDHDHLLILQYEHVVKNPLSAQSRLAQFLGVSGAPIPIAERGVSLFHSWEVQWKGRALEPVDPARISAWKNRLSSAEVAGVEMLTGSVMREFGYEPTFSRQRRLAAMTKIPPSEALILARTLRSRLLKRRIIAGVSIGMCHSHEPKE